MLTKRHILLGLFILSSKVNATSPQTHLYVGAQLGYAKTSTRVKSDYSHYSLGALGAQPGRVNEATLGAGGILGGLHAGVATVFCNTYILGLELSAELSNVRGSRSSIVALYAQNSDVTDSLQLKMTRSFDAAVKTGIYVTEKILGYIKLSVATSKWEMNTRLDEEETTKGSKCLVGFKPAVGVEAYISKNIIIGGELNYTFYPSFKLNQKIQGQGTTFSIPHVAKTGMAAFQLRVSYKL